MLDEAGAGAEVVALERGQHVVEAQAVRREQLDVGDHVVLLHVAAVHVDLGDARDALQLRPDDPILDGAEIAREVAIAPQQLTFGRAIAAIGLPARFAGAGRGVHPARMGVLDRPHHDLPEAGRDRPHGRARAGGKPIVGRRQAFRDLLAREIDVDAIGEDRRHLREAVARERPRVLQTRNPGERGFDRERHLLLDLDRAECGRRRVDLHLAIGDVGHGVDRQVAEGNHAERGDGRDQRHDRGAMANGKPENAFEHRAPQCSWPASPLASSAFTRNEPPSA